MFHIIRWTVVREWTYTFIRNDNFGIEVAYDGSISDGMFYLTPQFDQNNGKWNFYAFDTLPQRERFESILKIQWIWWKTAYHIASKPQEDLKKAVDEFDAQYFKEIPWVWPKTAKRLLVELKWKVSQDDMQKLSIDEKMANNIVTSLQGLGYSAKKVRSLLPKVPYAFEEDAMPKIMKWLIDHL